MFNDIFDFIKNDLIPLAGRRRRCRHEGESGDYCGKCGADLREITRCQCVVCSVSGRITNYDPDDLPDFCRKCGAPKFLFRPVRKKSNSFK